MTTYRTSKEIAALVRAELKTKLPEWKFSVSMKSFSGGSSITLALMSGPEEVIEGQSRYAQLNQYGFLRNNQASRILADKNYNNGVILTDAGWWVMETATKILAQFHRDDSDIQSDYFNCNFYMHVQIGKWDRDYQVVTGNDRYLNPTDAEWLRENVKGATK